MWHFGFGLFFDIIDRNVNLKNTKSTLKEIIYEHAWKKFNEVTQKFWKKSLKSSFAWKRRILSSNESTFLI